MITDSDQLWSFYCDIFRVYRQKIERDRRCDQIRRALAFEAREAITRIDALADEAETHIRRSIAQRFRRERERMGIPYPKKETSA